MDQGRGSTDWATAWHLCHLPGVRQGHRAASWAAWATEFTQLEPSQHHMCQAVPVLRQQETEVCLDRVGSSGSKYGGSSSERRGVSPGFCPPTGRACGWGEQLGKGVVAVVSKHSWKHQRGIKENINGWLMWVVIMGHKRVQ